jgi:Xaa-Pro aminopeptidase
MGPSFDTISSVGPNGAVIHYKPEKDTALKMDPKELYLLDSGV